MTTLTLALAPICFFFTLVYVRDELEREPLWMLIKSFILGALVTIPVGLYQSLYEVDFQTLFGSSQLSVMGVMFLIVALSEELGKYFVLRVFVYPRKNFNEPFDGIMYGAAVSLGFAALENVLYVAQYGAATGLIRMVTAIPLHTATGIFMGYFLGLAKFEPEGWLRRWHNVKGLIAAILLHGLYNSIAYSGDSAAWFALFLLLLFSGWLCKKAMRLHVQLGRKLGETQ